MEQIRICYLGVLYLVLLIVPNLLWLKHQPQGYPFDNENKYLVFMERIGEMTVIICIILFNDNSFQFWDFWNCWLIGSLGCMVCYELWWYRYFKSDKTWKDFYRSFLWLPVGGATLPVLAFFLLGIYEKNIWLILSAVILGIGHIGIHLSHLKELNIIDEKETVTSKKN